MDGRGQQWMVWGRNGRERIFLISLRQGGTIWGRKGWFGTRRVGKGQEGSVKDRKGHFATVRDSYRIGGNFATG